MTKIFTHWAIAFVTLFVLTYIGFQDPYVKEILRLKSFDLYQQYEEKTVSPDIGIVTIDEASIEKYGQWPWKRDVLADIIIKLRQAQVGIIVVPILRKVDETIVGIIIRIEKGFKIPPVKYKSALS